MLRSMYSAISGMQSFQTKLDVIGNNIANVDTTGFKAGRAEFDDILSQTMREASTPTNAGSSGGINPVQIGSGVKVAAIQNLFTQGADQPTGNPTDLAIDGDGMFVVQSATSPNLFYTRAGDFAPDANGTLTMPNGQVLMGWSAGANSTPTGATMPVTGLNAASTNAPLPTVASGTSEGLIPLNLTQLVKDYSNYVNNSSQYGSAGTTQGKNDPNYQQLLSISGSTSIPTTGNTFVLTNSPDIQIGSDGSVTATVTSTINGTSKDLRLVLGHIALATIPNPSGLDKVGDSLYETSSNSGNPTFTTAGVNGAGAFNVGSLEMSNVDLTQEFSEMIVAQRGFDANSKMIGTDNSILQDVVNLKNG